MFYSFEIGKRSCKDYNSSYSISSIKMWFKYSMWRGAKIIQDEGNEVTDEYFKSFGEINERISKLKEELKDAIDGKVVVVIIDELDIYRTTFS